MHEWGLVEDLVKKILETAKKNNLKSVAKIFLSLGKDDHITEDSLQFIFDNLSRDTILQNAKLEIKQISGKGIILESIEGEN